MSAFVLAAALYLQSYVGGSKVATPTRNDICECHYEQYRWPCSASMPIGTCRLATYDQLDVRLKSGFPPDIGQTLYDEHGVPASHWNGK